MVLDVNFQLVLPVGTKSENIILNLDLSSIDKKGKWQRGCEIKSKRPWTRFEVNLNSSTSLVININASTPDFVIGMFDLERVLTLNYIFREFIASRIFFSGDTNG